MSAVSIWDSPIFSLIVFTVRKTKRGSKPDLKGLNFWFSQSENWFGNDSPPEPPPPAPPADTEVSGSGSWRRAKRPVRFKVELVFWSASKWKNKVAGVLNKWYCGSKGAWRLFKDPYQGVILANVKESSRSFPLNQLLLPFMKGLTTGKTVIMTTYTHSNPTQYQQLLSKSSF